MSNAGTETKRPGRGRGPLIVSHRVPASTRATRARGVLRESGPDGLVSALDPVLGQEGGVWVGLPGGPEGLPIRHPTVERGRGRCAYRVEPVLLGGRQGGGLHGGFADEVIWPLCHGFQNRCRFETRYWTSHRRVNARFAEVIQRVCAPGQFVWVHGHHLMALGARLRERGCANPTGYFHHIPFPPPDTLEHLPWAREVLHSLLDFDALGFQTARDRQNFVACLDVLELGSPAPDGPVVREAGGRRTRIGVFPMPVDWRRIRERASTPDVEDAAHEMGREIPGERILIGVDRLDYTMGVPEKLAGFERALEKHPELRGRATLVQIVIPDAETIQDHDAMKRQIEGMVGRINGRFTTGAWMPIHYRFESRPETELLALYRAADVALVTPLREGMNLVSKEFVAASVGDRGVLVLSRFAGSADELGEGALLVNPHDVEGLADAIHTACTMPDGERVQRLRRMEERIRANDVQAWALTYLDPTHPRWRDGPARVGPAPPARPTPSRPGRGRAAPAKRPRTGPGGLTR